MALSKKLTHKVVMIEGKRQKDISAIDQKIISMYAKGLSAHQISDIIEDIYGFKVSEDFISNVTDDDNESSKYWLSVLNELKNRGVEDILLICAAGLSGIKEAIVTAYHNTEYQRCIVNQVINTLKFVHYKDKKEFASDLKSIYHAPTEEKTLQVLDKVTDKWEQLYPNTIKRWKENWYCISPIFKFSMSVREVIYTTNTIETLNSVYRKLNSQRSVCPNDTALLKALYLSTFEATKK